MFHAKTKQLLARPFHKFFNINELDETDEEVITIDKPHVVIEKLDGEPIFTYFLDGNLKFASKTGKTPKKVLTLVKSSPVKYFPFCQACVEKGFTPLFEFCDPTKIRKVQYKAPQLLLTALRHMKNGDYMLYDDMVKLCKEYDVPIVAARRKPAASLKELLKDISIESEIEGYVLRFDDGRMFKMKSLWYTGQGASSDLMCQEHYIWNLILNQKMDDVKSTYVQKALKKRIDKFTKTLYANLETTASRLKQLTSELRDEAHNDKVTFLQLVQSKAKPEEQQIVRNIFGGKDALDAVCEYVAQNTDREKKLKSVRPLAGNIDFYAIDS